MSFLAIDLSNLYFSISLWDLKTQKRQTVPSLSEATPLLVGYKNKQPATGSEAFSALATKPKSVASGLLTGDADTAFPELDLLLKKRSEILDGILNKALEKVSLSTVQGVALIVNEKISPSFLAHLPTYFQSKGIENVRFILNTALLAAIHGKEKPQSKESLILTTTFQEYSAHKVIVENEQVQSIHKVHSIKNSLVEALSGLLIAVKNQIKTEQKIDLTRTSNDSQKKLLTYIVKYLFSDNKDVDFYDKDSSATLKINSIKELIQASTLAKTFGDFARSMQLKLGSSQNLPVLTSQDMGSIFTTLLPYDSLFSYPCDKITTSAAYLMANQDGEIHNNKAGIIENLPIAAICPNYKDTNTQPKASEISADADPQDPVITHDCFSVSIDSPLFQKSTPQKVMFQGLCFSLKPQAFTIIAGSGTAHYGMTLSRDFIDYQGELLSFQLRSNKIMVTPLTTNFRFLHNSKRLEQECEVSTGDIIEIEKTNVAFMLVADIG